jgi:hypothetical protein
VMFLKKRRIKSIQLLNRAIRFCVYFQEFRVCTIYASWAAPERVRFSALTATNAIQQVHDKDDEAASGSAGGFLFGPQL